MAVTRATRAKASRHRLMARIERMVEVDDSTPLVRMLVFIFFLLSLAFAAVAYVQYY